MTTYQGIIHIHIPPPLRDLDARQRDGEEDHNRREYKTGVEAGSRDVVVGAPPAGPAAADPVVEEQTEEAPGPEAEGRGGRQPGHSSQHDGRVEVARVCDVHLLHQHPEHHGEERPHEPEVVEVGVDRTRSEHPVRPDHAPDYRVREERLPVRTGEMRWLSPAIRAQPVGRSVSFPTLEKGRNIFCWEGERWRDTYVVQMSGMLPRAQFMTAI